jgi:hypothetical protein
MSSNSTRQVQVVAGGSQLPLPLPFPLARMDEISSQRCVFCFEADNEDEAKSLLRCSRCKTARYCSIDCQRSAWKTGHKHICEPFKKGSFVSLVDFPGISSLFSSSSRSRSRIIHTNPTKLELVARDDFCRDFWSTPARLLFPGIEEDRWADDELPQPKPESLLRLLEPIRLMQATVAEACHALRCILVDLDSGTAAAKAYQLYCRYQNFLYEKGPVKLQIPKIISWLWQTTALWTASLYQLLVDENGDPDGERAARLRINRARCLQAASNWLSAGDVGFAGNDARDIFAFWWPIREFDQPQIKPGELCDRGRWDLCMALSFAAVGDARRAAKSVRATPETRALAYVMFARLGRVAKADCKAAVKRALALIDAGSCDEDRRPLAHDINEERKCRRRVIRLEANKVLEGDDSPMTTLEFFSIAEPFHIAESDDARMGGGHCEKGSDAFPCDPTNGCKLCRLRQGT